MTTPEVSAFIRLNDKVDQHRGSNRDWLARHEVASAKAIRLGGEALSFIVPTLFNRISDDRNLMLAWQHVAQRSGSTPGPDGETSDVCRSDSEIGEYARAARGWLRSGRYSHGPTKRIHIPKKSGTGTRPIQIPNLSDRVVHRAIVQVIQPLLDPQFVETSFGYRPRQSRFHALLFLESLVEAGTEVVAAEDVQDAFESVPQERLLDLVRRYLPDNKLMRLIRGVIRTDTRRGLRQGGALSPLMLNLYLHHLADKPWRRYMPEVHLLRYADDMLLVCISKDLIAQARAELKRRLIPMGLKLKGASQRTICDLAADDRVTWLGFEIGWTGWELDIRIAEEGWQGLLKKLHLAVQRRDPESGVSRVLRGWIRQQGPAYPYENREAVYSRLLQSLREIGFCKQWKWSVFLEQWERAFQQWRDLRNAGRPVVDFI